MVAWRRGRVIARRTAASGASSTEQHFFLRYDPNSFHIEARSSAPVCLPFGVQIAEHRGARRLITDFQSSLRAPNHG